jgi:hypothetical protein
LVVKNFPGIHDNRPSTNTDSIDPVILTIDPAVTPLYGGTATKVTGTNLENATLKIDGKAVATKTTRERGEVVLTFTSPALKVAGFKAVEVTTPKGKKAVVENGILYLDDVIGPQLPPSPSSSPKPTPSPQPSSSPQQNEPPQRQGPRVWGKR